MRFLAFLWIAFAATGMACNLGELAEKIVILTSSSQVEKIRQTIVPRLGGSVVIVAVDAHGNVTSPGDVSTLIEKATHTLAIVSPDGVKNERLVELWDKASQQTRKTGKFNFLPVKIEATPESDVPLFVSMLTSIDLARNPRQIDRLAAHVNPADTGPVYDLTNLSSANSYEIFTAGLRPMIAQVRGHGMFLLNEAPSGKFRPSDFDPSEPRTFSLRGPTGTVKIGEVKMKTASGTLKPPSEIQREIQALVDQALSPSALPN